MSVAVEPKAAGLLCAPSLFLLAGFDAVAGFPLACGSLPVCVAGEGVFLMTQAAWVEYDAFCSAELFLRLPKAA